MIYTILHVPSGSFCRNHSENDSLTLDLTDNIYEAYTRPCTDENHINILLELDILLSLQCVIQNMYLPEEDQVASEWYNYEIVQFNPNKRKQ